MLLRIRQPAVRRTSTGERERERESERGRERGAKLGGGNMRKPPVLKGGRADLRPNRDDGYIRGECYSGCMVTVKAEPHCHFAFATNAELPTLL